MVKNVVLSQQINARSLKLAFTTLTTTKGQKESQSSIKTWDLSHFFYKRGRIWNKWSIGRGLYKGDK
jgi:hypothetical protein